MRVLKMMVIWDHICCLDFSNIFMSSHLSLGLGHFLFVPFYDIISINSRNCDNMVSLLRLSNSNKIASHKRPTSNSISARHKQVHKWLTLPKSLCKHAYLCYDRDVFDILSIFSAMRKAAKERKYYAN